MPTEHKPTHEPMLRKRHVFKKSKGSSDKRLYPAVFDWDYYYGRDPELCNTDRVTHWRDQGFNASLCGSLEFDLEFYRRNPPTPNNDDLLNHWLKDGINKCQEGSAELSARVTWNVIPTSRRHSAGINTSAARLWHIGWQAAEMMSTATAVGRVAYQGF